MAVGLFAVATLRAGTLTWDPSANHVGSDGLGSWDSASLNWATGTSDTAWVLGDIAAIGSGNTAGTITLGANISAAGLIFNPVSTGSYYTLAASGSYGLTLNNGGSGGTVDINLDANATITAPILFDSNFLLTGTGDHTLTLSGSGGVTFGTGLTVTIGSGSFSNTPTLLAISTGGGGGGGHPNLILDGGTFQNFDIGHSGQSLTSEGGTGIFNTFDANNNLTSGVEGSITQNVAGTTFVLQDGTINMVADNSTFTAGTLQIGSAAASNPTNVVFGYQVSATNDNNLPTSAVTINLDHGTLTQAGANVTINSNTFSVDTAPNTIANNITLTGTGDAINPGSLANMRLKITGVISGGAGSPLAFNSDGSTSGVELSGANTYQGGTSINAGNVRVDTNSALGTGAVTLNPTSFASIQYGTPGLSIANSLVLAGTNQMNLEMHGNSGTWAGVISGTGTGGLSVTDFQNLNSQLTLSNNNTYTGPTIIGDNTNAVSLDLAGSLANSNITIDSHAGLTGAGTLNWNLINDTGDLITANGGLTISGLHLDVHVSGTQTQPQYVVANYTGGTLIGSSFAAVAGLPTGWSINYGILHPNEIVLLSTITVPTLTWAPGGAADGAGNWDTTTANWSPGGVAWTSGDIAAIGGGGTGNTITVVAPVTAAGLKFNALASGQYTIAGTSTLTLANSAGVALVMNNSATINAPIAFNNSLTVSGTGVLSFAGNNVTFGSGAAVQIGTGSATQIPTVLIGSASGGGGGPSKVVFDGGIFENTKSGNSDSTPYYSIDSGTATVNTFDAQGTSQSLAGTITQSGNDTFVLQNGTVYLDAANASTFTAGNLRIGNGSASSTLFFGFNNSNNLPTSNIPIHLNNGNLTLASSADPNSGAAADTADQTVGNPIVLTGTDAIDSGTLVSLTLTGNITGTGMLAANASGTDFTSLKLAGNNSYTGGTLINNGVVQADTATAFGTGAVQAALNSNAGVIQFGSPGLTITNSLILNGSGSKISLNAHGNSISWSGVISGAGGIAVVDTKNTGAAITLAGVNTFTGSTNVGDNTNAVSLDLSGSLANSNITIDSHAGLTGTGTLNWNLINDTGDLITADGGLTISGLNLKLDLSGTHTQSRYVIANYAGGTLIGTQFASVANLPTGWSVNYGSVDPGNIVLLLPIVGWAPGGNSDGSGNWDLATSNWGTGSSSTTWSNGTVATIGHGGTAGVITISSTGVSAGGITFNPVSATAPGQYTIAGTSTDSLTLAGSGTMTMNADATISAPMVGTGGLTVAGTHNLTISGISTYTGPTSVNSGTLTLVTGAAITGTTALTIAPAATVAMNSTGASDGITINYTAGNSPNATIRNEIIAGYNAGAWNGTSTTGGVINSATAAGNAGKYAIGYADGADGVVSGLGGTQEKVMLTLVGDATLAGRVALIDFTILINHYGTSSGAQWDQGDFNYDGKVNLQDFTLFLNNYGQTLSPGILPNAPVAINRSQVTPEPAALAIVGVGVVPLLLRKRRRPFVLQLYNN